MKIAISTDDFVTVSGHVGRCAGFMIYDVEAGEIKSKSEIENNFTHHGKGNHDHSQHNHSEHNHSHDSLTDALKEMDVLISKGMGKRLVDDFASKNIKTVITDENVADTAAILFEKGELNILENAHCRH
ncbi:MAG: hypothetical protein SCALA702_08410 [Melioribacteraceae bacterium]|nr:MAG: hypothetical protein SCALA702_08410 [Melioribacteraceae bacterium]